MNSVLCMLFQENGIRVDEERPARMKMRLVGWSAFRLLLLLVNDLLVNVKAQNATASSLTVTSSRVVGVENVHADWAAHLTESPVAAAAAAATLNQTLSSKDLTQVAASLTRYDKKEILQNQPTLFNTASGQVPVSAYKKTTSVSTERPPKHRNIELITRRPDSDSEDKDKRTRYRKGQKSRPTEPAQNDGPHQDSQTTWTHLPDRHQAKWGLDKKLSQDTSSTWGYKFRVQEPQKPDFRKARIEWGKYWPVHVYSTGGLFAFLSVANFCQLVAKLFTPASSLLISKGRFMCVTIFLLTATSLRATFLLVDPYNADLTYPAEAVPVLADLPLLCIAASFAIVFLSLLNITCVRLTAKNLQNNCVLALIIVLVSGAAISCDVVAGVYPFRASMRLISITIFTSWTILMVLCFLYVFKDINRAARRKHGESLRATFTKLHMEGADLPHKLPRPTICVAVRVSLINALLFLALNGGIIYGLLAINGVFNENRRPADPWPWWSQQLVLRMLELTLCILLGYTVCQGQSESDNRSEDSVPEQKSPGCLQRLFSLNYCCCESKDVVHNYESCSDIVYGFRNENFNTSLDFSNVPTALTNRSHAWGRGQTTAPFTFQGRSEESAANSARSHTRNSLLAHPIQALSSLGSGRQSRSATNSTVESSQRHSTILFRDKLRRGTTPAAPVAEAPPADEEDGEGDDESIRARMGSRIHSITEEDAMLLSSPFFPRFKRSHCSSLDNSIDVSSDQLSSLGQSGPGGEYVAHHHRRTMAGSTCSSESAANSFDVAFFLNSNPYLNHSQAVAAQREFMERLVRHEQERHMKRTTQEDRRRFLEEYERIQEEMQRGRVPVDPELRSISPIVSARSSSKPNGIRPRLNSTQSDEQACSTQDHSSTEKKNHSSHHQQQYHSQDELQSQNERQQPQEEESRQHKPSRQHQNQSQQQQHQPPSSMHKMSLDLAPSGVVGSLYPAEQHSQHNRAIGHGPRCTTTTTAAADEDITPDSAVYLDLHMSPSDDSRDLHTIHNSFNSLKRASRSFLSRINSTFSLSNKSYAPLESADECVTYFGAGTMEKMDRRQRLRAAKSADALAGGRGGTDMDFDPDHDHEHDHDDDDDDDDDHGLQHGDSGLLVEENSQRSSVLCDSACQTEPLCT